MWDLELIRIKGYHFIKMSRGDYDHCLLRGGCPIFKIKNWKPNFFLNP